MLLEYELEGAGWATATLHTSQDSVSMVVSYLHDSLQELTTAALLLCKGASYAEVGFLDEPGEHRLLFQRSDDNTLILEVLWFDNWPSKRQAPDETVLRTKTTAFEVRKRVLDILSRIEQKYGIEGYLKEWINHDFPQAEYQRLKALHCR